MRALALGPILALCVGASLACGGNGGPRTFREPQGRIAVGEGRRFDVTFEASPGIGYTWRLSRGQKTLVRFLGESERSDNPGLLGGLSTQRFRFRAQHRGSAVLTFVRIYRGRLDQRRTVVVDVR